MGREGLVKLLTFIWVAGLLAGLLWSPALVAQAMEWDELANSGQETVGQVEDHGMDWRREKSILWATIGYDAGGRRHLLRVQGAGASQISLPKGTAVTVRYLPAKPTVADVDLPRASVGRGPGWPAVVGLWSATFAAMAGCVLLKRAGRKARGPSAPRHTPP